MAESKRSIQYRLVRRVAKALGVDLEPEPPEPKAPADAEYWGFLRARFGELFRLEFARKARYREYDEMDYGAGAAQLDALVDACTVSDDGRQYGFQVKAGAKYQGVIDRIIERTDLNRQIRTFLRTVAKYGDLFVAPVFDEELNIVSFEAPHPRQIKKNVDDSHRLQRGYDKDKDGKPTVPLAFQMIDDTGHIVAGWEAPFMRHIRFDGVRQEHLHHHIYSMTSFFEPMRKDWRKLQMIEEGMTIARLSRAYPTRVHYLDHTGKTTDERQKATDNYIDRLKKRKLEGGSMVKHPVEVDEDLFASLGYRQDREGRLVPSLTKIDMLDPQIRGLTNINDVEYLLNKMFLRMSKEVVGISTDREDINLQDVASSRMYLFCQRLFTEDLIWPVLRLGLLLKGYIAKRSEVEIVWPDVAIQSLLRFAWQYNLSITTPVAERAISNPQ